MERVVSTLANHLCQSYQVHILIQLPIVENTFPLDEKVTFFSLKNSSSWVEKCIRYIARNNIRLVIGNSSIVLDGLPFYQRLTQQGIPYIICNHENFFYPIRHETTGFGAQRKAFLLPAQAAVFLTSFSERVYHCLAPNGVWIPNPRPFQPDSAFMRPEPNKVLVAVGRWNDPNKRVDRIFRVFRLVLNREADAKLYVVGPVDWDAVIPGEGGVTLEMVYKLQAFPERSVVFTGQTDHVENYFKLADVSLMASESEGFGMVLLEAAAYGVPSVLFEIHGLEDIITHGENGFICPQDDVQAMALCVLRLFEDKVLYQSMRAKALQMVSRFSRETVCERWGALIEAVLSGRPDLAPFQSPFNFTTKEAAAIAREYQAGIESCSLGWQQRDDELRKIKASPLFRLFLPLFRLIDKIRKWVKRGKRT